MNGAERIAAERQRQIAVEGWTPEHDAGHADGDLRLAAIAYAQRAMSGRQHSVGNPVPDAWPWAAEYWKPTNDPIRNLVKAGALIAAEIDRLLEVGATRGGHTLTISLTGDRLGTDLQVSITCHEQAPKQCAIWYENAQNECRCRCVGCEAGNHDDCDQPIIENVGRQWCQCHPSPDECIHTHNLAEAGWEVLDPREPLTASWPVNLTFTGFDEPMAVEIAGVS